MMELLQGNASAISNLQSSSITKSSEATRVHLQKKQHLSLDRTSIAAVLCDVAERFITSHINPAVLPSKSDPKVQLADNFAPVPCEFPPQECSEVCGKIPSCLQGGIYIRNGPNPLHTPVGGYHFFDGHGMLHGVKFQDDDGSAPFYSCRFTKTSRFQQEVAAGRSLFPNPLGDMHGMPGIARMGLFAMRVALGVVNFKNGIGTANAGLVFHNGTLLAMSEDDMPYAVRISQDGDFQTLGRYGFLGDQKLEAAMTAHPKLDPVTGELHCYSCNVVSPPFLKSFNVSVDGVKSKDVPIPLPEPVVLHDFVVTENFLVFPETQMAIRVKEFFLKQKSALVFDEDKVPRFGVFRRGAEDSSDIKWFELPGFTAFHFVNGWEEGDEIILLGSQMSPLSVIFDDPAANRQVVSAIHLNMKTGLATQERICSAVLDIGQYNHRFTGRKMRYVYFSIYGPWPKFSGIAKIDLAAPRSCDAAMESSISETALEQDPAVVAWRKFGDGCFGSEPFFVPRTAEGDEDDGFLLSYVHDENSGISRLLIMDARSPTLETVASIKLPPNRA